METWERRPKVTNATKPKVTTLTERPKVTTLMKAEPSLQQMFAEFNTSFFGGRLPTYTIRRRAPHGFGEQGYCDTKRRIIWIVEGIEPEYLRRTLLHEMCHIGEPSHGRRFQAKLLGLAEHGETWAADEVRGYQGQPRPQQYLRQRITDLAIDMPQLRWSEARRYLALEFIRSQQDFTRSFPWARAAWQREKAWLLADNRRRRALGLK